MLKKYQIQKQKSISINGKRSKENVWHFCNVPVTEKKIYRESKQKLVMIKAILDKAKILVCLMHC